MANIAAVTKNKLIKTPFIMWDFKSEKTLINGWELNGLYAKSRSIAKPVKLEKGLIKGSAGYAQASYDLSIDNKVIASETSIERL